MRGWRQIVAQSTNGTPARPGARVGRGERDAAREPGDDGPEAPGGGEARDAALGRAQDGERQRRVVRRERAAVAHAAADQREDDVLAPRAAPRRRRPGSRARGW